MRKREGKEGKGGERAVVEGGGESEGKRERASVMEKKSSSLWQIKTRGQMDRQILYKSYGRKSLSLHSVGFDNTVVGEKLIDRSGVEGERRETTRRKEGKLREEEGGGRRGCVLREEEEGRGQHCSLSRMKMDKRTKFLYEPRGKTSTQSVLTSIPFYER